MKHIFFSLLITIILLSSCHANSEDAEPQQGTVVATVLSYDAAKLSGDVLSSMHVSFSNTTKSAGRIGVNQSATMCLSGIPAGWLTDITVWMHSNQASGAGDLNLSIGEQYIIHKEGSFDLWTGAYSTVPTPIRYSKPVAFDGSDILLVVIGTTNSIFIDRLEVSYSSSLPKPRTVILYNWNTKHEYVADTLTEIALGEGVILPDAPDFIANNRRWNFIGWVSDSLFQSTHLPMYWDEGSNFDPRNGHVLYALYSDYEKLLIQQCTQPIDGEYILTRPNMNIAIEGVWSKGVLEQLPISTKYDSTNHLWFLTADTLPAVARYELTFERDSVMIRNVGTNKWLGYNEGNANLSCTYWAWTMGQDSSFFFHHDMQWHEEQINDSSHSYWEAYAIGLDSKGVNVMHRKLIWDQTICYWILFPSISIPERSKTYYWSTLNVHE